MSWLVALLLALRPTPEQAAALSEWDPVDLTPEQAADHVQWARFAGSVYRIDPVLLLAIAHHESRFHPRTVTREPGHRVSCGVMTPVPKRHCRPDELTLEAGYLAG